MKLEMDLPIESKIFILWDLASLTSSNEEQEHFWLRAILAGKTLVLETLKYAIGTGKCWVVLFVRQKWSELEKNYISTK